MTMSAPKIELRRVSQNKRLSEETPAYAAQVWVDGAHFCDVSNHGQGGPDEQRPPKGKYAAPGGAALFYEELKALEARIRATMPPYRLNLGDGLATDVEQSLELICHTTLYDIGLERDIKRDLAKRVLFVKPDGQLYSLRIRDPKQRDKLIAAVKQEHGIERTLNEMPLDEVVATYKRLAA